MILVLLFRGPQLTGFAQYAYYSVMYILWGMTYTVLDIPYWSMLPSMSSTKEERDSMSVIPRIFASSAWLLIGVGLTIFGYVENVAQTPETIMGMRILMGVVPSVITVLAFVIYVGGYKLDGGLMQKVASQLKAKRAAEGTEDTVAE